MRCRLRWTAALAATVLGLAACSGPAVTTAEDADVSAPLPAHVPGRITIGVTGELTSIDPNRVVQEVDVMSLALVSGTLLRQVNGKVTPNLASGCEVSADAVRVWCELREDLRFSDGSPLGADDAVASFRRAMTDEANANGSLVASVAEVEREGPRTVMFTLKRPTASFLLALTESPLGIWPAEKIDDPAFFRTPVSAGPYTLTGSSARGISFTRNAYYPTELQPVVKDVDFNVVVDSSTRLQQLNTGQLDMAYSLPPNLASQVRSPAKVYATQQYGGVYLYMNHGSGPLSDVRVRKAISAAIDRDQINRIAYLGKSRPLGSFLPSVMEGHDSGAPTGRDVDAARELLAGTACQDGCDLRVMQRAGFAPYDKIATIVQQNLADVGIRMFIDTVDQSTANSNEQNGNFEMEVGNLYDVVNSPELIMLTYGLHGDGGIRSLYSEYDSPKMNGLVDRLMTERDPGERATTLREINALFRQDLPYAPLVDYATVWGSRIPPRVAAFTPSGTFQIGTRNAGPGK
ncbi:ABC transporter substrate-binding protein [Streptomyces sp. NPDC055607]